MSEVYEDENEKEEMGILSKVYENDVAYCPIGMALLVAAAKPKNKERKE